MTGPRALAPLSVALLMMWAASAFAAPTTVPPPRPPPKPLPNPPTFPLIRIEAAHDHLLILEDISLGRGEWTGGDLDLFVAFGAPGLPRAIDARLYAEIHGTETTRAATPMPFEPVRVERAYRRPPNARLLLGSSGMAGAVLHVRDAAFRHATQASGFARIRDRTLLDPPTKDARTGREVVIRLGSHQGEPDALSALEIASDEAKPWVTRAEAHLCGPSADPHPLDIRLDDAGSARSGEPSSFLVIAPVLSVRHATDDLCVRFWTTEDEESRYIDP